MTYIENIFVCMAAPLLVGAICAGRRYGRSFVFVGAGMFACLISAYLNTFFAGIYGADGLTAAVEIAPVVEEILKLLPLLFYLLVFEPRQRDARMAIITVGASFATFENVCYLVENGASQLSFLFIRGFGAGAMHIVCGAIVGYGLVYTWKNHWLRVAGTLGLLCAAITYHAIYNLLISMGGGMHIVGSLFPILTALAGLTAAKKLDNTQPAQ
ncbi:MAG: PrsW family glutamic-type intramembrane protease [Pseudoflavonifractor sp.]